jgi:methylglyoxal reductase
LAQGLLTGKITHDREFGGDDLRKGDPRFSIENRKKINSVLVDEFEPLAEKYGLTLAQLSVAALISQDSVVALCGIRNEKQAKENAKAGDYLIEESDIIKIRIAIATLVL